MRIGFVGAGKVGTSLGKYFVERDLCVSGYYSRNLESSKEAANFTNTKYYDTLEQLITDSDTLFLTVPDGVIGEVYSELLHTEIAGMNICHCSGALSSVVFSGIRSRGAYAYSIHPIYAIHDKWKSYQELSNAYFTIEGDRERLDEMTELIRSLGNPIEQISVEQKVRYHAAAVCASNLVAGLYDFAAELLQSCGLSESFAESALLPLFLDNAKNIAENGTVEALTGPVERGDAETVKKHLAALSQKETDVYRALSHQVVAIAKRKHPKRDYTPMERLLKEQRKGDGNEEYSSDI